MRMFLVIGNSNCSSLTLSFGSSDITLLETGDRITSDVARSPVSTHGSLLVLFFHVTDTEIHSPAGSNLTKSTSTKSKQHVSISEPPFTSSQDEKPCTMGSGHDLHVLLPTPRASYSVLRSHLTNYTHHHSCTNAGHQGSCLTQQSLAQLQEQLSLYHADTRAMLNSQETKHEHQSEVAQSVDFDLPNSLAEDFTAMTPMERYKEEQEHGMGPWTTMSRRREVTEQ
jgi:hypothetical protein